MSANFAAAGSDTVAPDPRVEKAVQWAIEIANDPRCGYSQGAVNATPAHPYTGSREGPDYDCSSLVYHAFTHGGFDIISVWQKTNPKYFSRYGGRQYSGDADNNPTGKGRYETGDQGGEIDCYNAHGRGWLEVYRYTGK